MQMVRPKRKSGRTKTDEAIKKKRQNKQSTGCRVTESVKVRRFEREDSNGKEEKRPPKVMKCKCRTKTAEKQSAKVNDCSKHVAGEKASLYANTNSKANCERD